MYEISKTYAFEAAHHIDTLPEGHKCKRPHGHSYKAEFVIACEQLNGHGFVMDFADIDQAVQPLIKQLDHRDLNEVFDNVPLTSEFLAGWLFYEADIRISGGTGVIFPDNSLYVAFIANTEDYVAVTRNIISQFRTATPRLMKVRVSETDKTYAEYTR